MKEKKGVTILEFSVAGIPALFVFNSAIEMALGQSCQMSGNSCGQTVGTITTQIADNEIGIPASSLNVTFTSASSVVRTCAPITTCTSSLVSWPPVAGSDNLQGRM